MKRLILLVSTLVLIFGCAKNRPVELKSENDNNQLIEKSAVQGNNSVADVYFSKITVVATSTGGGPLFVGYESDMNVGYFDFTEKYLQFKSIQGPYMGRESADSTAPLIFQFPVSHHQVQLKEANGKVTNNIIDDQRLPWQKRPQFKVDFGDVDSASFGTGSLAKSVPDCFDVKSRSLVDDSIQTEAGYFSYVVETVYDRGRCTGAKAAVAGASNYTLRFRYSFRKKEPSKYKAWYYDGELDPKIRKFGYFQSVKQELDTTENGDGQVKNLFIINRWDPSKEHNFYFTKEFPEEYKHIFYNIFKDTNKMFKEQGLAVRFHVRENTYGDSKTKEFGDLRYSFINVVDEISPSGPLGYGPSNANPFTGEIISANLSIYASGLKYYIKIMEASAERNEEKFEDSDLFKKMAAAMKYSTSAKTWDSQWEPSSEISKFYSHMTKKTLYAWPAWHWFTQGHKIVSAHVVVDKAGKKTQLDPVLENISIQDKMLKDLYTFTSASGSTPALVEHKLINYTDYANDPMFKKLAEWNKGTPGAVDLTTLDSFKEELEKHTHSVTENIKQNARGHCIMNMEETLAGAEQLIIDGFSHKEIIETVLYRVGIHELGHNLSLRHNFYGSVDKANFRKPVVPKYECVESAKDENGIKKCLKKAPVLNASGEQTYWPAVSSSVMDYLRLQDEYYTEHTWENYDRAALAYLYSGGVIEDKSKSYLFCTDEHTISHALCNRHDLGQTPTEVVMSYVKSYEDGYYTRNRRFNRAYWDTSGYNSRVFSTMKQLKEFLPMWRASFYESHLRDELTDVLGKDKDATEQMITEMNREIKEAIKLSMAFYQAVLQTSNADKPFRSEYDEGTGALLRMGIGYDKLVAMYFLAGDDAMFYNPNRVMLHASYMTYANEPELATMMKEVLENIVTQRVDMEPWFIGFGRGLYAKSAMNFYNRDDESIVAKIKIKRYSAEDLERYFDYKLDSTTKFVAETVRLTKSTDADFDIGKEVAIVLVNSSYYMFSTQDSPYAYDIYKNIKQAEEFERPSVQAKLDLVQLYFLYNAVTTGFR